jgi:hypothetical protein
MNEHGSQGQSAAGSELLLGMHGFVGGQSQSSGRAPGLQHAAFVSRGWRRIEVKTTEAHSVRSPSGVRRSGAGVGGSVIDPGAGYDSAGGYYSRDVSYRPWMEDEKRSSQPSHSWGPVRCSEWPYQAALPCHVIIELLRPFRGHIISGGANHGGTMPKRWAKEGREGPAAAQRRERTQMSSHCQASRPAKGRETEFPSLAHSAWKTKGCRVGEGSRDALPGWASRWIVRRISGVLSWVWCLSLRRGKRQGQTRSNATQPGERRWHAARRTPGEALQLCCDFNVWHCTPWPASHSLSRSSASKTGRLGHTSRICASRDWVYPCTGAEHWRVEAWNFPDNGGEAIVAWSFGSESRDGGPGLYPIAHHESIIRPSLRFWFIHFWAATTARRRWGATSNHFQTMTMLRRGVLAGPEREL